MVFLKLKKRILSNKLINDSFWSLFGNVVFRGLSLLAGIIIARLLGKDIFGEYGIIKSTIISIATFSTFGLGYTTTKYVAEFKNSNPINLKTTIYYSKRITLINSLILALVLFFSANYFAEIILESKNLVIPLRIVAVLIVFNALTTLQIGILSGLGKFKEMARINFILGILILSLSPIMTYKFGLNGALLALLFTQILNWYLNYKLVNRFIPSVEKNSKKNKILLKQILIFSTPVALQEALYSLLFWFSSILLIKYSSFGELGLYTAALQWSAVVLFIPGILRNVVLSHLSSAENNDRSHKRIMNITLLINFSMTFFPALIVFLLTDFIAEFYGESFDGINKLISISIFTTVFLSISNVYAQAYLSKGLNWQMLFLKLLRDLGIIFLFLFLLNYYSGAIAMIVSTLIMSFVFMILIIVFYRNKSILMLN